jgi:hypothetical protein
MLGALFQGSENGEDNVHKWRELKETQCNLNILTL